MPITTRFYLAQDRTCIEHYFAVTWLPVVEAKVLRDSKLSARDSQVECSSK